MKKPLLLILAFLMLLPLMAQDYDPLRIEQIKNNLVAVEADIPGLTQDIDIALQQTQLATFLMGVSEVHKINIDVNPSLRSIEIINNFKNVPVLDVLVYLCKLYNLDIDMTGTILSISQFKPAPVEPEVRVIPIQYDPAIGTLFADLKNDNLAEAFKAISEKSGKGIFFAQGMENEKLSAYIRDVPFDVAMEKLAFSNNLIVTKTKDGSFEFEKMSAPASDGSGNAIATRPKRSRRSNFYFKVLDAKANRLDIDLENVAIADVVYDIGNELQLDIFTAAPLDEAGSATVKARNISFDELLGKIFESAIHSSNDAQNADPNRGGNQGRTSVQSKNFTYKKENGVYYFGTSEQLTLRSSEVIPLYFRSIQLLSDPQSTGRTVGRTVGFGQNGGFGTNSFNNGRQDNFQNNTARNQSVSSQSSSTEGSSLIDLIPQDIQENLSVTADPELNSFIVSGATSDIIRFKEFIKKIDKPVPVVMIEVMILDISRSATLEAGVEWGIGERPSTTQGTLFPHSQVTLGANTVNRILGRIDGSSFFNIGKVVPNFYANIKAMETNGLLKVRSSPRITTLNGHRAYFSNGETSYYAVTNQTFIGSQNPATSEITNYQPIDAELSLDVKPFVSADGEITMDIKVIQSSFNGERIAQDAPPGINSREFTSIVKARNNDIIVLGGLEEKRTSNSGSGVPFLARIPIIKWLFSQRVREGSKSKLTVLIKPTVIY